MPKRDTAPIGAPCWVDLWTSDVEGSRRFYSELFGWEAQEPSPEFGGYFMFTRSGVPVAGGMGDMGPDAPANNTWKVYLATDDVAKTVDSAEAAGAQVVSPAMPVADLGVQAVLVDPTGAEVGTWQPGTFQGFVDYGVHGAPGWFELDTRDYDTAVPFYREVFRWDSETMSDLPEFRYTTLKHGSERFAGILDAAHPENPTSHWSISWWVDDTDAAVAAVRRLGGSVVRDAEDTPYGRLAAVADPSGAQFWLMAANQQMPASG